MQFGAVCVSWHSAMKFNQVKHITSPRHQHQVPILIVPDQDERTLSVYDVIHEKFLDLKVFIPHTERFCGSSKGWLMAVNRDYSMTLYKPYFMAKNEKSGANTSLCLNLPRLFPRSPEDEECFSYPLWSHHVFKAIITADPLEDANKCIVLTIFGEYLQLAYTGCAKDTTWTMIGVEHGQFDDILCGKNQVYALSYHGILISFDITDSGILIPKFVVPGISPSEVWQNSCISKRYIVESYGELFRVFRYINFNNTIRRTVMFEVLKLEYDTEKWIHIDSLGDVSFFLGDSSSIAVLASNFAECEPNCIYFTQDEDVCFGSFISSIRDLGIFELESRRFKLYFNMCFTALRKMLRQPPIWIVPTVDLY